MWLNIRWGSLYVVINLVQLGVLYYAKRSVELDPESAHLCEEPLLAVTGRYWPLLAVTVRYCPSLSQVGNELAAVASDKPFRYPRALPYVLRAFECPRRRH